MINIFGKRKLQAKTFNELPARERKKIIKKAIEEADKEQSSLLKKHEVALLRLFPK